VRIYRFALRIVHDPSAAEDAGASGYGVPAAQGATAGAAMTPALGHSHPSTSAAATRSANSMMLPFLVGEHDQRAGFQAA
jgi:hypothetical protein